MSTLCQPNKQIWPCTVAYLCSLTLSFNTSIQASHCLLSKSFQKTVHKVNHNKHWFPYNMLFFLVSTSCNPYHNYTREAQTSRSEWHQWPKHLYNQNPDSKLQFLLDIISKNRGKQLILKTKKKTKNKTNLSMLFFQLTQQQIIQLWQCLSEWHSFWGFSHLRSSAFTHRHCHHHH